MTVLHLVHGMDPKLGGVCQAVRTMISGLANFGCTSVIVSLDDPGAPFLKDIPCEVHGVGPASNPWAYSPDLLKWLNENLSRFDTVIVHGLWLYYGYAATKAINAAHNRIQRNAGRGNVPSLLVMPHGMLDPYFQKAEGRKLKALRNWFYWKLIEKDLIHTADGLLFTCEEERNLARQTFRPYKPKNEFVVSLGVDDPAPTERKEVTQSASQENEEVILFLSRIHEKKGVDLLINAFSQVPTSLQRKKRLLIVGPGLDTDYGKRMQTLARRSVDNPIEFLGMLTGDAKWAAFRRASAFALPSHQENFGIAVVEALACAKPVLISDQVNIWREIANGGGGIIGHDTMEGAQSMLKTWTELSESEKQHMSQRARKVYEEHFAVLPASKKLFDAIVASQKSN